ncbi:hypothetical protein C6P45_003220 [Maudiozyma exigua]|uniref:Pentacotripeptide-repeat region of PRORP domain-containing protein n=1 Tax=Maudiozyma exigua TaxID=34358 RepID=A0A9P7B1W6_MAUEX|nr:hypothetical protein C6P45_003220 [Kazachstania exigua]
MTLPIFTLMYNYNGGRIFKRVTQGVRRILEADKTVPLTTEDNKVLLKYFADHRLMVQAHERKHMLNLLRERGAHEVILKFGRKHLFVVNNYDTTYKKGKPALVNNDRINNFISGKKPTILLKDDVKVSELRTFIFSLIAMRHTRELDTFMETIISQIALKRRGVICDLISASYNELMNMSCRDPESASKYNITYATTVDRWVRWVTMLESGCEFTSYSNNRSLLRRVMKHIDLYANGDRKPLFDALSESLDLVNNNKGITACSQLGTTFIYLSAYCKKFTLVEKLWKYKLDNKIPIHTADLTTIMRTLNYKGKFEKVGKVYESHPEAHHDSTQFDYLLLARAKTLSWKALKSQFDGLFGIGKLPNIRHYEIVMYSLALLGDTDGIDKLFAQLLRRGMIPTYPILQSMLQCHYKSSNSTICFQQFQLFEKYSIRPTAATYTIMFKVHRKMNDITGALRLLKTITEENLVPVVEEHFVIIMQMCAHITNHLVAREIFNIMKDHYDINPSASTVATLMDVYTEAQQYDGALTLFQDYSKKSSIREDPDRISIYSSALYAKLKAKDEPGCDMILEDVSKLDIPMNQRFYEILLRYMVNNLKDYEGAEKLILKMIKNPKWNMRANSKHFEILMGGYSRISYNEGVFKLYKSMTDNDIRVNSKILYYLVKSTFKVQMSQKEDLTKSIDFVDKIMIHSAENNAYTSEGKFHPSIIGWALRTVAKYYSPKKALEMLNRYDKLFYDKNIRSVNNKFSLMRSLVVLFAELGDWQQFEIMYQNIWNQIERYERLPTSTVPNVKLRSLFVGIFSYEIRHLKQTSNLERLPGLLNELKNKNFVLDNHTWNEAILALASTDQTIEHALKYVDTNFIHGYNLIHKNRLLTKLRNSSLSSMNDSWFLEKKREKPTSFIPKLYLESETFDQLCQRVDRYLNSQVDPEDKLRQLVEQYKFFMKSYLLVPHHEVRNWDSIERNHNSYFEELRSTKRAISVEKF